MHITPLSVVDEPVAQVTQQVTQQVVELLKQYFKIILKKSGPCKYLDFDYTE